MRRFFAMAIAMLMIIGCSAMAEAFEAAVDQKMESGWENILLMGGDTRDMNSENYGRTDSMIILSINRDESLVKMTSIMRDTWVEFPGTGKSHKINAGNVFGGPELAVKTVNTYFGTDIEDYVIVNMEDMEEIVDLLGGVDIETTAAERKEIEGGAYESSNGMTHLNGKQAVSFSRIRYIDSDYSRVMRQQRVLLAMAKKAQDMEVDALMDIAGEVSEIIVSSLEKEELKELATAFMVMEVEDVEQFRVPADGTFQSGTFNGTWMIRPDFEKNKTLLKEFIYGE